MQACLVLYRLGCDRFADAGRSRRSAVEGGSLVGEAAAIQLWPGLRIPLPGCSVA